MASIILDYIFLAFSLYSIGLYSEAACPLLIDDWLSRSRLHERGLYNVDFKMGELTSGVSCGLIYAAGTFILDGCGGSYSGSSLIGLTYRCIWFRSLFKYLSSSWTLTIDACLFDFLFSSSELSSNEQSLSPFRYDFLSLSESGL